MKRQLLREIMRRRVPSVVGFYLAAGWGLLEFTDWSTTRFGLPEYLENTVVIVWGTLLPLVAFLAWRWGKPAGVSASKRPRPSLDPSVAVLPFTNLSGDPGDDYLGDGLAEEAINALAKIPELQVASRTSAFTYKGGTKDVRTIGRELDVGSVLEGSVKRSGNRIRVTTQLVDVEDGYHLWSERFDREMEDVFAIEDEIAEQVARALKVVLKDRSWENRPRIQPSDIRAYEYYLRGQQFLLQSRAKSLRFAREMFGRAIEMDSQYAPAWAGAAEASALLHMFYPTLRAELEDADGTSQKALGLAPELAEAHASRGLTLFLMRRPEEAEEAFQQALRLDPELFQARYFHGRACFQDGRLEEAASEFQKAARIREDYQAAFFAAQALEALGRQEEAQEQLADALAVVEKHMELNPDDPRAATMRAVSLCRLGRPQEGHHWAERALEIDPEDASVCYNVACLFSLEGIPDRAIQCLERALEKGFVNKEWFQQDPDLEPLREDPRFLALMARI